MTTFFAKFISRFFDLYSWSIFLNLLFLTKTGLNYQQFISLAGVILLFEVILPLALFIFFLKKGLITDLDLSSRRQRPLYFSFLFLFVAAGGLFGLILGSRLFFLLQLIGLFLIGTMTLISFFWKISGHAMINAAGIFFINFFFPGRFWWLFLLLLPVSWSRWYLKKHSLFQLAAGALVGLAVPYVTLHYFR